jgi:hypothetical protein
MRHRMAGIFCDILGIAITLLGLTLHLQLDTLGFLYFASDVFYLAFDLVFVHEVSF